MDTNNEYDSIEVDNDNIKENESESEAVVSADKVKITLLGSVDRFGDEYYFSTTHVPMNVDLNGTVIHVFPWEDEENGTFGLDIVFRKFDPDRKRKETRPSESTIDLNRKRRRTIRPYRNDY